METLAQQIAGFIDSEALFSSSDKILVAISGGPDSVFLAHILHQAGYSIGLAHVNYQTRGVHSEAEEELVRAIANTLKVPIFVHRCELKKQIREEGGSFQVVAREIRYSFFEEVMDTHSFSHCATAHHRDDRTENMIMSLIRGNSTRLISDIPLKRDRYVRPLAQIGKAEMVEALDSAKIAYSIDSSNLESHYTRNRIRNLVMPLFAEINPSIQDQLISRMSWYDMQFSFIHQVLAKAYEEGHTASPIGYELSWELFTAEHGYDFLPLFIAFAMDQWGVHGYALWAAVGLASSENGKYIATDLGKITRTRNGIQLLFPSPESEGPIKVAAFTGEQIIRWNGWKIHLQHMEEKDIQLGIPNQFYLDLEKITWPITIRHWEIGDKMIPFGMRGQKKLSDIFIDQKRETTDKENAVIIEDQQGIIALSDFRIAAWTGLSSNTRHVLRIQLANRPLA